VEKHQLIINELEKVETWKDEESFLVDALIMSNAKLFIKSYKDIEEHSIVTVAPLLRQVHENIIAILGIGDGVITMKNFIDQSYKPKTVMNKIKDKNPQIDSDNFDFANNYLFGIKKTLNVFTHTNFEGIMTLFTERFQVFESMEFNKIMMKFFVTFLEGPFIAIVNSIYKLDIELPPKYDLNKELKRINSLKYITRHFPEPIKEFINNSEVLNGYYKNIINSIKKASNEVNGSSHSNSN
jgi:hypothetical protein